MSAAVWNEPQDPESRRRQARRGAGPAGEPGRNGSVLMMCAPRPLAEPRAARPPRSVTRAAEPRPAETTA
jgi:hypothetical protein